MARAKSHPGLCLAVGAILIFALVLAIYLPILPGSFVMDDERLVKAGNPIFTGELTPRSVWFQTDFPLTLCAWWGQWLMWGDNPAGYHAANILLQALSAILLWRVLARLKIPGAWLAGVIFAVHPVCVGSVARIAELKNTLSLPFFLASFWAYLRYESASLYSADKMPDSAAQAQRQGTLWFSFSLIAFVLALLSKTTTIMLPLALLGCAAWQRGRITRRDVLHTAPFFLLSFSFGLMSVWFQKYQALAGEILPSQSLGERITIAGRDFWFYCGKAVLPINLTVFYSRWRTDLPLLQAWLPTLLMAALFVLCWRFRRTWGKHALFGVGCFAVLLFPALGFFDAQCFTKFQVSDHLQYLPLIALVSLAAGVLAAVLREKSFYCVAIALVLMLSVLSFKRAQAFATQEGLLRDTLAKNPAAWAVHNDLGVVFVKRGNFAEAADEFKAALQSRPNDPDFLANLGLTYAVEGQPAAACVQYRAAIKLKPTSPQLHERLSEALEQLGDTTEAIDQLKIALRFKSKTETRLNLAGLLYEARDFHHAVDQLRCVLSADPDNVTGLNNLAYILTNCSDGSIRNGPAAIELAERACRLTGYKQIPMVSTLAAAYREGGRASEASATADMATRMQLAVSEGQPWPEKPAGNKF
jgi:Flp pilus assembly protein TadD